MTPPVDPRRPAPGALSPSATPDPRRRRYAEVMASSAEQEPAAGTGDRTAAASPDLTAVANPGLTDEQRRQARDRVRRALHDARERWTPDLQAAVRAQLGRGITA